MASTETALQVMREICLALPDTTEANISARPAFGLASASSPAAATRPACAALSFSSSRTMRADCLFPMGGSSRTRGKRIAYG